MQSGYDYKALVDILRSYDTEEEWFEFKSSNSNPEMIGKDVSSLSNGAALSGHPYGYLIWGIDDNTHDVIGTTFKPKTSRKGNDDLLSWLITQSYPRINLDFIELKIEGKNIVILEIPSARKEPQRFADKEYIRIGASIRELRTLRLSDALRTMVRSGVRNPDNRNEPSGSEEPLSSISKITSPYAEKLM